MVKKWSYLYFFETPTFGAWESGRSLMQVPAHKCTLADASSRKRRHFFNFPRLLSTFLFSLWFLKPKMNLNQILNNPNVFLQNNFENLWTIVPGPIPEASRLYTTRLTCTYNQNEEVNVFDSSRPFRALLNQVYRQWAPIRWRIYFFHRDTLQINRIIPQHEGRFVYFRMNIEQRRLRVEDIDEFADEMRDRLWELAMAYVEEEDNLLEAYEIIIDVLPSWQRGDGLNGWPIYFKNEWCSDEFLFNPQGSQDCLAKCLAEYLGQPLDGVLEIFERMLNGQESVPELMEELQQMFPEHCFRVFALNAELISRSPEAGTEETCCNLLLAAGHYFLIRDMTKWVQVFEENETIKFCEECCRRYPDHLEHHCRGFEVVSITICHKCGKEFANAEQSRYHRRNTYQDMEMESPECVCGNTSFISKQCLNHHQKGCLIFKEELAERRRRYLSEYERNRGQRRRVGRIRIHCKVCNMRYYEDTIHGCKSYFKKTELKDENQFDSYYVFDFESMFHEHQPGVFEHEVNYVYVRKLWDDDFEKEFKTVDEFVEWLNEIRDQKAWVAAHNFKGYDGRLLHAALLRNCPVELTNYISVGTKLNTFSYANLTFADSLLHIAQPLDQFPKSFGLDISCKGFFPYLFNTPENQTYVGPIPAQSFFQPDKMSVERRKKFLEWYAQQGDLVYDFKKELVTYCKLDVEIMKKGLEVYAQSSKDVNRGMNPLDYLTTASYSYNVWRTLHMPQETLVYFDKKFHDVARAALRGGRTDVRCILKEWTPEQVFTGAAYGVYADVQSMYPYIMYSRDMPVGQPERKSQYVRHLCFGIVHCDLEPPPTYQHHPALCIRDDVTGRLVAPLNKELLKGLYLCTPELEDALDQGYVLKKVYYVDCYDKSTNLFREYISKFLKIKVEKSQECPSDERFYELQRLYQAFGVVLDKDEFEYNPGRRQLAKNSLNNLWGKLCERVKHDKTQHLIDPEKFFDLELLEEQGQFNPSMKIRISNNSWFVRGEWMDEDKRKANEDKNREKTMPVIGAFITMYGRKMLFDQMKKLDKRALYHDTDSIVYEHSVNKYGIEMGECLGDWEDELKGKGRITHFTAIAPKTYAYKYVDVTKPLQERPLGSECWEWEEKFYELHEVVKIKGIKQSYQTMASINYKTIKELAMKELDELSTMQLNFIWNAKQFTMCTKEAPKITTFNYLKGSLGKDNHTYPPGVEQYQGWEEEGVCETGALLVNV